MLHSLTRTVQISLLSTLLLTLACCGRHSEAWKTMDVAESLMNSRPDSALTVLDAIVADSLTDKHEAARYALLKSMALDKNIIDTTTFDVLQPAIDYFPEKGSPDEKMKTYYYQGRIYQNKGDDKSALRCFLKGREYCAEASDTLAIANLLVAQAAILYTVYNYEDYIRDNLEAARLYKAIGRTDYEMHCLSNALDGGIITDNKQFTDSLLSVINKRTAGNEEYSAYFLPNKLRYSIYMGDKKDAIKILNHYDTLQSIDESIKMDLANAYCEYGDAYNAKRYLDAIDTTSLARGYMKYLAIKPDILEMNGDVAGALAAYRDFTINIDSIQNEMFHNDLLFTKQRYELEKYNQIKLQSKDRIILIYIIATLALLGFTGFIYYRYKLVKTRNMLNEREKHSLKLEQEGIKKENANLALEKDNAILEKEKVELECERQTLAAENLRNQLEQFKEESSSLKEILKKHKDLERPIGDAIKTRIKILNGLLATHISGNESYAKQYTSLINQIIQDKDAFLNTNRLAYKASYPKFMDYLEQCGLTENEINYVCLYAIGLRGKEVGSYIRLSRHYHISSDIRKKLGINEHQTNIGIYIRKLMEEL